ncbi:hypothetical protein HMPREF9374_3107 [Desmospora sp. 8437]|nr:hypothetical protein HMPREF9374_3107 [Desmospora sp. 8437]
MSVWKFMKTVPHREGWVFPGVPLARKNNERSGKTQSRPSSIE